jgi:DNA polymerase-3 subunit beta
MKFTCDKNILCEAINNVSLAVASKSSILSLEGILMRCKNSELTLTGYNLELGIVKNIPVSEQESGEIVINASLLSNIVNKMPSGQISFSSNEKLLTVIQCNDVEFTVLGLSSDDYPEIPMISQEEEISISQETFKSLISQTLFAIAQTDQTPVYTGTLFDLDGKKLTVVSVDGYRLAMRKETLEGDLNKQLQFIVPGKTLSEIQKLLAKMNAEEEDQQIKIKVSNKHIIFDINGYSIISRLLEGNFVDYHNAIPKSHSVTVKVNTRDFINSINRASIIINDRAKSPIKCEFLDHVVKINCETTLGKVQDSFEAEIEGDPIRIGFNNKYMLDALRASECDKVMIQMNDPTSPILLLPLEGEDFLFMVMPVRI